MAQQLSEMNTTIQTQATNNATYYKVTMENSQRIIAQETVTRDLAKEVRALEGNVRTSHALATEAASRRRTDGRIYFTIQAGIEALLVVTLAAIAYGLWRIAALVEVLAR